MNKIVKKSLLARYKFMPKMLLRQLGFTYDACGPFTKNEEKKLKKQVIQDIFIKTNWIKLAFNMVWIMKILKIYMEEQFLIRH